MLSSGCRLFTGTVFPQKIAQELKKNLGTKTVFGTNPYDSEIAI